MVSILTQKHTAALSELSGLCRPKFSFCLHVYVTVSDTRTSMWRNGQVAGRKLAGSLLPPIGRCINCPV